MEVRELRIGNLVNEKWIKEDQLREVKVSLSILAACISGKSFQYLGIPLTEKWLIKFGFNKRENDFIINLSGGYGTEFDDYVALILFPQDDDFTCTVFTEQFDLDKTESVVSGCDIKYVHQLQNLYFALKGEELTFNE